MPIRRGKVLLATFSSVKPNEYFDPTCLIRPGEHPFVKRETWVNYAWCRIEPLQKLKNGINAGLFRLHEPVDQSLLARICQGLFDSPQARPVHRAFYLVNQPA